MRGLTDLERRLLVEADEPEVEEHMSDAERAAANELVRRGLCEWEWRANPFGDELESEYLNVLPLGRLVMAADALVRGHESKP
jgi:hypothetical protein